MTPYEIDVQDTDRDGFTIVEVAGELDLTNENEIERRLEEIAGDSVLILDLNRVTFVDSAALHMLFRVARRLGGAPRLGIVLEPSALVARTLTLVGLDEVTTVKPTVDELVAGTTAAG